MSRRHTFFKKIFEVKKKNTQIPNFLKINKMNMNFLKIYMCINGFYNFLNINQTFKNLKI